MLGGKESSLTLSSPRPSNKAQKILEGSFKFVSSKSLGSLDSTISHPQQKNVEEGFKSSNNPKSI